MSSTSRLVRSRNDLVLVQPERIVRPADRNEDTTYTSITLGGSGASSAVDPLNVDPLTGLPTIAVTIPEDNTDWMEITYNSLTPRAMNDSDIWLPYIYLPGDPTNYGVHFRISADATMGSNYRVMVYTGNQLAKGHNILSTRNLEVLNAGGEDTTVGTTIEREWIDTGNADITDSIASIQDVYY